MARLYISRRRLRGFRSFRCLADLLVIVSLLFPSRGEGLAFLRVMRLCRVFHAPMTLDQLRDDVPGFRRNETTIRAGLNLVIYLFAMTALVYQTQTGPADCGVTTMTRSTARLAEPY